MAAPPPFLLTPLLLLLALSLTSAAAFVHPGDLEVLEDLRRSIKNPEALGWANGADPCASPRVSCDRSGRVRNLDLSCANLSGALPASFSNLQALQSLKLQGNSLSGPLPSFRGMAALRHAYLSGNSFDTIPSDFFEGTEECPASLPRGAARGRNPSRQRPHNPPTHPPPPPASAAGQSPRGVGGGGPSFPSRLGHELRGAAQLGGEGARLRGSTARSGASAARRRALEAGRRGLTSRRRQVVLEVRGGAAASSGRIRAAADLAAWAALLASRRGWA